MIKKHREKQANISKKKKSKNVWNSLTILRKRQAKRGTRRRVQVLQAAGSQAEPGASAVGAPADVDALLKLDSLK